MNPFFTPAAGITGDTFPFYHEGVWHLFHMCMPGIAHHSSRDLVTWERRPDVVGRGAPGAPDDGNNATGSVVVHAGVFHLFYTGNQNVCHAVSTDLDHWTKDPANPIVRPDARYDQENFRDPYVFWQPAEECWWMLLGSRRADVPCRMRGGAVALATSTDLSQWVLHDPLHLCNSGPFVDCPQLVAEAGRWWLSTLPYQTRVRVADSPRGPFQRPAWRDLETPMANAGTRSASDGRRRVSWPFLTRLRGEQDLGGWEYGGCLCLPRELAFGSEGLSLEDAVETGVLEFSWMIMLFSAICRLAKWVLQKRRCSPGARRMRRWNGSAISSFMQRRRWAATAFLRVSQRIAPEMVEALRALPDPGDPLRTGLPLSGTWNRVERRADCDAVDGGVLLLPDLAADCFLEAVVAPAGPHQDICLCFRVSADLRQGYQLELSPATGLASVRRFDEWDIGRVLVQRAGAVPAGRPFRLQLVICGSACEIFVDERWSLSLRCYDLREGTVALEFRDGGGTWSEVGWRRLGD